MMRRVAALLGLVLAACAFATTASAAIGGPGPTPDVKMTASKDLK